jgi:hypothetical protein
MVLAGQTLSPAGHCQATGKRATLRALRVVNVQPRQQVGPIVPGPWAKAGPALCPHFFNFQFLLHFQKIM